MTYDVVIPTVGRPSLQATLDGLLSGEGPSPEQLIVVDDRRHPTQDLRLESFGQRVPVVRSGGVGPASARNAGARAGAAEWIAFLDDDVIPAPDWRLALAADIQAADTVATQGRVRMSGPAAEKSARGLETGLWITADMAYRRDAFLRVGGFDERFPRAYREDSDLGLRIIAAGGRIAQGRRWVEHPMPPQSHWWSSVARQRGNADDALMLFLHGRDWQDRAGAPRGDRMRHLVTAGLFAGGIATRVVGRKRLSNVLFAGWLSMTGDLVIKRGHIPSSVAIPFAATWWWVFGLARAWRLTRPPRAVLFDRDGTLIEDEPYNGDPLRVRLRPGARAALDRLRATGIRVAMVTNQSGVARGLDTEDQVNSVNRRVEELVGPLDVTLVCVHGAGDGCECRKPRPGLVVDAARRLGVRPRECAVIGDIESDLIAAKNAGARGVLVPNDVTRPEEITRAKEVAGDLEQAVDRLLATRGRSIKPHPPASPGTSP